MTGKERAQIGFATFDNQIQFYSLQASRSQPQMLVIPDADDPYCPPPQSLLAPLKDCQSQAEGLLDQIPRIYAGTNHLDGCATAAMEACILALKVYIPHPNPTPRGPHTHTSLLSSMQTYFQHDIKSFIRLHPAPIQAPQLKSPLDTSLNFGQVLLKSSENTWSAGPLFSDKIWDVQVIYSSHAR